MKKDITVEEIEHEIRKYFRENSKEMDDCFIRKLTPDEVAYTNKMAGGLLTNMGTELYRLPGGAITGIGGVKLFNQAFKEHFQFKNINNGIKNNNS